MYFMIMYSLACKSLFFYIQLQIMSDFTRLKINQQLFDLETLKAKNSRFLL